jgi:hypothetical protein
MSLPATITLGGASYAVHPPKSPARAAAVMQLSFNNTPVHIYLAATLGLCVDAHGVVWKGSPGAFGEAVFDALQAKRVTFTEICDAGGACAETLASAVLFEHEVAAEEGFTAAP